MWKHGVCLAAILCAFSAQAAQPLPDPGADPRLVAALAAARKQPHDPMPTLAYARLAIELGDYEGALSALERVVMMHPNLTAARLEMALVWMRLGQPDAARPHLRRALADTTADPVLIARAKALREEIGETSAALTFNGFASIGLRHDTNANGLTDALSVPVLGLPLTLDDTQRSRADTMAAAALIVLHDYRPTLDNTWLRGRLSAVGTRYAELHDQDTEALDYVLGPVQRIKLMGMQSEHWLGLAAGYRHRHDGTVRQELGGAFQWRLQAEAGEVTLSLDARALREAGDHGQGFGANLRWSSRAFGVDYWLGTSARLEDLGDPTQSGWQAGVNGGISLDPRFWPDLRLTLGTSLNTLVRDAAEPLFASTGRRHDLNWRLTLGAMAPLSDSAIWQLEGGWSQNDSTHPLYDGQNLFVSVSLVTKF